MDLGTWTRRQIGGSVPASVIFSWYVVGAALAEGMTLGPLDADYDALAVFFGLLPAFRCDVASAFFAAHRCRIRSAAALRCAWLKVRFFFVVAGAGAGLVAITEAKGFLGGRPRRFVGP